MMVPRTAVNPLAGLVTLIVLLLCLRSLGPRPTLLIFAALCVVGAAAVVVRVSDAQWQWSRRSAIFLSAFGGAALIAIVIWSLL
ncbi:MAG: hypothetical protein L0H59_04070 [Tomitella sp.]|nr:hypothetical protein [Tomitella sp.]